MPQVRLLTRLTSSSHSICWQACTTGLEVHQIDLIGSRLSSGEEKFGAVGVERGVELVARDVGQTFEAFALAVDGVEVKTVAVTI